MEELAEVVAILEPQLGAAEGEPSPLEGGITNRNFRMRFGGADYVLRICGRETAVLGIDRAAELAATRAAHAGGGAPAGAAVGGPRGGGGAEARGVGGGPAVPGDALRAGPPRRRRAPARAGDDGVG